MQAQFPILHWLDSHGPAVHWGISVLLISFALWRAIRLFWQPEEPNAQGHDWFWAALIFVILLAGRFPWLILNQEINADESQIIAGAHNLMSHPVFWRDVDTGTSGPLNCFVLCPLGALFGWQGYAHARITALLLVAAALIFTHFTLSRLTQRKISRLALLPALTLEAISKQTELHLYSTELLSVTLLSATFYIIGRSRSPDAPPLWSGIGGMLLGMVPLAKLQAAPIAAGLGLGWVIAELIAIHHKKRGAKRLTFLCVGAILPWAFFTVQLLATGEWNNMFVSYFLGNMDYVYHPPTLLNYVTIVLRIVNEGGVSTSAVLILAGWLLGIGLMNFRGLKILPTWLVAGLIGTFLLAIFSVAMPARPYPHYFQLLILPSSLLLALALCLPKSPSANWQKLISTLPVFVLILPLTIRAIEPNLCFGILTRTNTARNILSQKVSRYAKPGDKIAVWGWSSYLYVETGTLSATRAAMSAATFYNDNPVLIHHRALYLLDIISSQPPVFVDTIGPMSNFYKNPDDRHDQTFPGLARYIADHYTLVDEYREARIYRRIIQPQLKVQ